MPNSDLTDSDLAYMTRALADYYAREDTPDGYGWLAAEARMFEKRCGPEVTAPDVPPTEFAELCVVLCHHYGRIGAMSWSVQLEREAHRLRRESLRCRVQEAFGLADPPDDEFLDMALRGEEGPVVDGITPVEGEGYMVDNLIIELQEAEVEMRDEEFQTYMSAVNDVVKHYHGRKDYFRTTNVHLIDREELVEVMSAENRNNLFIGGTVNQEDEVAILFRGNLERIAIPLSWFSRPEQLEQPDFSDFEVTDCGQTVRFGRFEASTDAVLYGFDSEYRRAVKGSA